MKRIATTKKGATRKAPAKKGTAPREVPEGLGKALFVRVDAQLLAKLDALKDAQRQQQPGTAISRADLVRSILWAAIQKAER